ncbi:MAG: SdrD B-like domain-containing protein [Ignavibacteriaceae bacterium]|jgi:photosystem II stability/assembly factor-like uncharacterized protein
MKKYYEVSEFMTSSLFKMKKLVQTNCKALSITKLKNGIKSMTKLKFVIILFLFLVMFDSIANAQWVPTGLANGTVNIVFSNGTNLFAGLTNGALISTDNGSSWNYTSISATFSVWSFAVNGTDIFAGTTGGLFRSTDNGLTWNAVNSSMPLVQSFAVIGTTFFAGTEGGGVYFTTDNGTNWTQVNTGLTNLQVRALISSGTKLFAGTLDGVFLSTDNGSNWAQLNTGLSNLDVRGFAVLGTNIFAGTNGGIFRSNINTINWTNVAGGLVRGFAVTCGTDIYAGGWYNGGGVIHSTDNGTNWTSFNTGLTTTTVPTLAVKGTDLFAGTWNGGVFRSPTNCTAIDSTGSICGIKFNDLNGNGIQDPGELGLANWEINLTFAYATGPVHLIDSTDANGNYCFNDLQPGGTYTVFETNQSGWQQTSPPSPGTYTIPLTSGEHKDSVNFGNKLLPVVGSICGIKFSDLNGNGIQDPGEMGLANWIINLKFQNAAGFITLTDTTDANGNYCFNDLQPGGTYTVFETNQSGWQQTSPPSPGTYTIPLASGEHRDSIDFGNRFSPIGSICDSLQATVAKSDTGDCCWSISLIQPSNTNGITGIQFLPLSPNTFALGSSQLGSNYSSGWLFVTNTTNQFTVRRLTGNVPAGALPNFFNFCMNNLSSPQFVVVNWLDVDNGVVCSDTVTLNCEIPCVTFNSDTVICNTNDYTLQYSFTNNATYAVNKIEVIQTVPAGITVTPSTMMISNVNPGQSSGLLTFNISGALPNTTVAIHFRFTSADSCCFCTDVLYITTPSCMCEDIGANLNQDLGNCRDTLNIFNNFSGNYFTQINLTVLPAGTTFSNWNTNTSSNWYSLNTFAANTIHLVNIGSGFIPSGNSNGILDFVLSGYTTSTQKIVVEWIRNDSVKCVDTLITHCVPPPPTMYCTQLVDDSLVCLPNGTFQYKFKIKNNSTDSTTGFQLNAISPSSMTFNPSNFSNVTIGPSMVSPEQTVIISGIGANTPFCFDIALFKHIMQGDTLYSWCCHSDTICTTTPTCGKVDSSEACITWDLLNSQLVTSSNGNITGTSESISTGSSSPFMGILPPYTSNGQRLFVLGGWPVGSLDLNRFIEFKVGPNLGNSLTVNSVSFNFGDNPQTTNYNIINSQVFYSTNNFSNSAALGGTLAYLNTTMSAFALSGLNIFVGNGQTFALRIYPYSPTGSVTATVSLAIHNNVVICGTTSRLVGIEGQSNLPTAYALQQNYPNPFNPSSTIRYDIPKTSFVKIVVYNILGREIRVLMNEEKNPGHYEIIFDATDLASGIYYYTITTGDFTQSKKMILLK